MFVTHSSCKVSKLGKQVREEESVVFLQEIRYAFTLQSFPQNVENFVGQVTNDFDFGAEATESKRKDLRLDWKLQFFEVA